MTNTTEGGSANPAESGSVQFSVFRTDRKSARQRLILDDFTETFRRYIPKSEAQAFIDELRQPAQTA